MNKSYNIVCNTARNMYVVASEFASGNSRMRSHVRAISATLGLVLSGVGYVNAAEVGPQNGASIALQDGDTVTLTAGGIGITSTTSGGSGLHIDGKALVTVSGSDGSIGIKLANGVENDLGVGTEIRVVDSGTSNTQTTYGLYLDQNAANTKVKAEGLLIHATGNKGINGIYGSSSDISLGKGSSVWVESDSGDAVGISLRGSSFSMDEGAIHVEALSTSGSAFGINSSGSYSLINLGNNTQIDVATWGRMSYGTYLNGGASLIANGIQMTVVGSNSYSNGITLSSNGTDFVDLGTGSSIDVINKDSFSTGVTLFGNNPIFTASEMTLSMSTTHSAAMGIGFEVYSHGVNVDLGSDSTISMRGYTSGSGIDIYSDALPTSFKANRLTVDVTGDKVYGIDKRDIGSMDLGTGSHISANGQVETILMRDGELKADALAVNTAQSTGLYVMGGIATIGAGSVIDGTNVGASGYTNGIRVGENGSLNFNGTQQDRNTIHVVNGYGIFAQRNGQPLTVSNTDIVVDSGYALWAIGDENATNAGTINASNITINTNGHGYGVIVGNGGTVNLSGKTTIMTEGAGSAILNPYVSNGEGNPSSPGGNVIGTGVMNITGNIYSAGDGIIDLSMDTGSLFNGWTYVNTDALRANSVLNLTLADQTQWIMTGSSSLTNLTNAGSIVSSSATPGSTLSVNGDYVGNSGTLTLNTQLDGDDSLTDKLVVNGNTSGTTTLMVNSIGGQGVLTTNGIEVVNVSGSSDGVFTQGNRIQANLYEYRLYKDGNNWYLRSLAVDPTPTPDPDVNPDVDPVTPQYRPDIGAFVGNQSMTKNLQMQTLYDREGSQYLSKDGAVWMRFKAGMADSSAANGNVDIDNHYSQIQLGGDLAAWRLGEQRLNVGVMGSYVKADTDSTGNRGADGSQFSASGSVDGYNLGVYATWFADAQTHQGLYVDSWYQYGMYDNTVDNRDLGSVSYDSTANAVSLETGYRHDVVIREGRTLSLIPQAQVVWQNYKADAANVNGVRVDGQNGDSWTSRLGIRVAGKLDKDQNTVQPFLEANWLHSTDDVSVSFDGASVKQDLPADRAELKAGIQANWGSQWSVAAQAVGQKGSHGYGDASFGVNVRYSW